MQNEYVRTIIFLNNDNAAKYYRENIYPHEIGTLIVTADKTWPKDPEIRKEVWNAIEKNEIKCCIAIGTDKLNMINHINNLYVIDQFLENDHFKIAQIVHYFTNLKTITEGLKLINPEYDSILSTLITGNKFELKEISFEEIKDVWDNKLWPGRDSPKTHYEPEKYPVATNEPTFFGLYANEEIIGVNSGYETGDTYRSRGLWLDYKYRKLGLSKILLNAVIEEAQYSGSKEVWSLPNLKALHAYKAVGFTWSEDTLKLDWGENKYAVRKL